MSTDERTPAEIFAGLAEQARRESVKAQRWALAAIVSSTVVMTAWVIRLIAYLGGCG